MVHIPLQATREPHGARDVRLPRTLAVQPDSVRAPLVLFVDDNADLRDFAAAILPREGYAVCAAEHGLEALRILKREPVDVLVTDLNMPLLDGRRLALRAWALAPDLPIVFASGDVHGPCCLPTRLSSQTLFLAKPYFASELADAIRSVLPARSLGAERYATSCVGC